MDALFRYSETVQLQLHWAARSYVAMIKTAVSEDVPELASLCQGVLRRAPWPKSLFAMTTTSSSRSDGRPGTALLHYTTSMLSMTSNFIGEILKLTVDDWLALIPIFGCIIVSTCLAITVLRVAFAALLRITVPDNSQPNCCQNSRNRGTGSTKKQHNNKLHNKLHNSGEADTTGAYDNGTKKKRERLQQQQPLSKAVTPVPAVPLSVLPQQQSPTECQADTRYTYWLTRVVLLRGMGLIYLAAFMTSAMQGRALFGTRGLSPVATLLTPLAGSAAGQRPVPAFTALAALGLEEEGDIALEVVCWTGAALAATLALGPAGLVHWSALPAALWVLYLSVVNLGARVVIGYGWEWSTLEIGLLCVFLGSPWPRKTTRRRQGQGTSRAVTQEEEEGPGPIPLGISPPPMSVIWLLRWAVFRLLIGAGMSKLGARSSACWRELTCTETHYATQPMPNFMAWFFHHLPPAFHRAEVALTFVEQLGIPFLCLLPWRPARLLACAAELFFQLMIAGTGNYAWINWIGALPALALLDDSVVGILFSPSSRAQAKAASLGDQCVIGHDTVSVIATASTGPNNSSVSGSRKKECQEGVRRQRQGQREDAVMEENEKSTIQDTLVCENGGKFSEGDGPSIRGMWSDNKKTIPKGVDGVAGPQRNHRHSCSHFVRRSASFVIRTLLVTTILCKSTAPLKELFTPAPWLAYYDDYFLVNAQGVFGFVNKHRVVLVLEYTHTDPAKASVPSRSAAAVSACRDQLGIVARDASGHGYTCADIAPYCSQEVGLRRSCPRTCGTCNALRYEWSRAQPGTIEWRPLEFKNLPGSPTRRPRITAPYHYRLDWETWIATTASMEHHLEPWLAQQQQQQQRDRRRRSSSDKKKQQEEQQHRQRQLLDLPVPGHIRTLVKLIMRGDTDAIGLLGTTAEELLLPPPSRETTRDATPISGNSAAPHLLPRRAPTAIRARYYLYTYSDWATLRANGTWWDREPITGHVFFEAAHVPERSPLSKDKEEKDEEEEKKEPPPRRCPWQRHWLLLIGAGGTASALCRLHTALSDTSSSSSSMRLTCITMVAIACAYAACWYAALICDYSTTTLSKQGTSCQYIEALSSGMTLLAAAITARVLATASITSFSNRIMPASAATKEVNSSDSSPTAGSTASAATVTAAAAAAAASLFGDIVALCALAILAQTAQKEANSLRLTY